MDHRDGKNIAHFDVYFLHSTTAGDFVEKKHIDLENYPFPFPANEPDAKNQLGQYVQLLNSKEDTTSGPIAVLNFHGKERYDFRLVAKITGMEDATPTPTSHMRPTRPACRRWNIPSQRNKCAS